MAHPITFILADDDPVYREIMLQYLQLIPNLDCIAICESAIEAAEKLQRFLPDLLILDVEMPGLTGIQLAKSLTQLPLIIFISSHLHYAADAFEVDAIDYLVKPVVPQRLARAIEKARALLQMKASVKLHEGFKISNDDSFFIKDKNSFVKINYSDVLYIESLGDFVHIFLKDGDKKIALVSLKSIEKQLPAINFIRISRTHMVSKEKVTSIETTLLRINKIQLPIGKTYAEMVLAAVIGNAAVKRFI